ncbi:uncharacterized protein BO80DRAFT_376392 [Aspergillus ibericus CBS 121593]|uniref:Uncharacterized protein n=1 Tax=Aspergillus ibericus CBS 121593 TaxID=1448316 RepID=A0A395H798_9EURO|nr:hypothetical protein BO80DRAFT_376392 [Aspergillus ibericus CBS 121593]RAL03429.1 hypothetical protein BO80DRAFT_376392 [Aspergillus ibericus CBS 121593]
MNCRLKQHNHELKSELSHRQKNILGGLPMDDSSDASIQGSFVQLRDNLSNWVEHLPYISDGFRDDFPEALVGLFGHIYDYGTPESYPEEPVGAESELLTQIIFRYIWDKLFDVLIPGSSSDNALLSEPRNKMRLLTPTKDIESINGWRSDTLRAYASLKRHESSVDSQCIKMALDLQNFLGHFKFEQLVNWDSEINRLMKKILTPAATLATNLSCSLNQYRWVWYENERDFAQGAVRKGHLEMFTVLDVRTHNKVSIRKLQFLSSGAPTGEFLGVIYPALFRCGDDGRDEILIEKGAILMRSKDDLQGEKMAEVEV